MCVFNSIVVDISWLLSWLGCSIIHLRTLQSVKWSLKELGGSQRRLQGEYTNVVFVEFFL